MKVLWVEDHERHQHHLMVAGTTAVRRRIQLDLIVAPTLMEAERRLRLEHFDLVVLDLRLPDSREEDMTLTRIATMGNFRMAVVSASDHRDSVVEAALRAGCDCAPRAVAKEDLPIHRFASHPNEMMDFLKGLMPEAPPVAA